MGVMRVDKEFKRLVEELKRREKEMVKQSRGLDVQIHDSTITRKIAEKLKKDLDEEDDHIFGGLI